MWIRLLRRFPFLSRSPILFLCRYFPSRLPSFFFFVVVFFFLFFLISKACYSSLRSSSSFSYLLSSSSSSSCFFLFYPLCSAVHSTRDSFEIMQIQHPWYRFLAPVGRKANFCANQPASKINVGRRHSISRRKKLIDVTLVPYLNTEGRL